MTTNNKHTRLHLTALIGAAFLSLPAIAPAISIPVADDAMANETAAAVNNNYGRRTVLDVYGTSSNRRWAYINFGDITQDLPSGTTAEHVTRAVLYLYVTDVLTAGSMDVYPVNSSWVEGTQVSGAEAGSLSWNLKPGNNSAIAGSPYSIAAGDEGEYIGIPVTALVQDWISTPGSNYGIVLKANGTALRVDFGSKEDTGTSHPPILEVMLDSVRAIGTNNTAVGPAALDSNFSGSDNTALGTNALTGLTTTDRNTAVGVNVLASSANVNNTGVGYSALSSNTSGSYNAALGSGALIGNNSGTFNSGLGHNSLVDNTSGIMNAAIGYSSGYGNITGGYNVFLGGDTSPLTSGDTNSVVVGYGVTGKGSNSVAIGNANITSTFISGINGVTTPSPAVAVLIDGNGQLGTISSSRRYKEDIADMGSASARLDSLRPVTFRYKKPMANGEKPIQFGLIAEEVAAAFPELAVFNAQGQPETVKYHDLIPLLLNEFLKERREGGAREKEVAELKVQLATLRQQLAEQADGDRALIARLERLEGQAPAAAPVKALLAR